jgi:hypothetical protein
MKVENSNLTGAAAGGTPPAGAVGRENSLGSSAPGRTGTGDRVELSGSAAKIGTLLSVEARARAGRVAALARDFQSGRYQPDAAQTSRALVAETLGSAADSKAGGARK